eukprot:2209159-Pleurochrysis_carterae.AAC.1
MCIRDRLDALAAEAHLQLHRVGHQRELVDERAHDLGGARLGYAGEEWTQLAQQRCDLLALAALGQPVAQLVDGRLLGLERLVA